MSRVFVVGSANIDVIARVERLPSAGQTLLGTDAALRPGGKGANQAVAARRLGADTTMVAAVGDDAFGERARAALREEGVRLDHVRVVDGMTTGIALIVVAADGENLIVVAPGANQALDGPAVQALRDEVGAGDVLLLQLEIPVETCRAAAALARAAGARVVLNAAPAGRPGDPAVAALLAAVDVLVVNETEALALLDAPAADPACWTDVAAALQARGPAACVITLGATGAAAYDGTSGWVQPAFAATVVDTTGAGDAFCGALAAALSRGATVETAVRHGCAAGALASGAYGAQTGPTRAALDRLLAGEA